MLPGLSAYRSGLVITEGTPQKSFMRRRVAFYAVEAEDRFVEIRLHVLASETTIDLDCRSLEVREEAMAPGQMDRGSYRANDVRVVDDARRARIAGPAVGLDGRFRGQIWQR